MKVLKTESKVLCQVALRHPDLSPKFIDYMVVCDMEDIFNDNFEDELISEVIKLNNNGCYHNITMDITYIVDNKVHIKKIEKPLL